MSMLDWNGYRQQVLAGIGVSFHRVLAEFPQNAPRSAVTGRLDAKIRELIVQCDGCITVHTEAARKAGAAKEEIAGERKPAERAWETANNTYAFSNGLGTVELIIGFLVVGGLVSVPLGLAGAVLAFLTPFVTLSVLIMAPEAWVAALGDAQHGFPISSVPALCVQGHCHSRRRMASDRRRSARNTSANGTPSRGRTSSLRRDRGIYIVKDGRINVGGLPSRRTTDLVQAVTEVLAKRS